jgi:L-asparaginase
MKRRYNTALLLLVFFPVVVVQLCVAQAKKLPNVVVLATGGTIAGAGTSGTQAAYTSGAVGIDTMGSLLLTERTRWKRLRIFSTWS